MTGKYSRTRITDFITGEYCNMVNGKMCQCEPYLDRDLELAHLLAIHTIEERQTEVLITRKGVCY